MAKGDFGKAFGSYRKSGGLLSRSEFAKSDWKEYLPVKKEEEKVEEALV